MLKIVHTISISFVLGVYTTHLYNKFSDRQCYEAAIVKIADNGGVVVTEGKVYEINELGATAAGK